MPEHSPVCWACGWTGWDVKPIDRLHERLPPAEPHMPVGACPECGKLCFMEDPSSGLVIRQFLDVSTKHMTEADSKVISQVPQLIVTEYPEGFWVTVPDFRADLWIYEELKKQVSETLLSVLLAAAAANLPYVCFDRDAPVYERFSQHDW